VLAESQVFRSAWPFGHDSPLLELLAVVLTLSADRPVALQIPYLCGKPDFRYLGERNAIAFLSENGNAICRFDAYFLNLPKFQRRSSDADVSGGT